MLRPLRAIVGSTATSLALLALCAPGAWAAAVAGQLDTSFGTAGVVQPDRTLAGGHPTAVEAQADNKLLVAVHGLDDATVLRYTKAGALDTTFGGGDGIATIAFPPGNNPTVEDLLPLDDGRIVAGGTKEGTGDPFILRLTATGTLDTSFNAAGAMPGVATIAAPGLSTRIRSISRAPDGRLFAVGHTEVARAGFSFDFDRYVFRASADGAQVAHATLGTPGVHETLNDSAATADGLVVVGWRGSGDNARPDNYALAAEASTNSTFDRIDFTTLVDDFGDDPELSSEPGVDDRLLGIGRATDGKLIAVGTRFDPTGAFTHGISIEISSGASFLMQHPGWGIGGLAEVRIPGGSTGFSNVAVDRAGKVFVSGWDDQAAGYPIVAKLTGTGTLDTSYNDVGYGRLTTTARMASAGFDPAANDLAALGDGRLALAFAAAATPSSGHATALAMLHDLHADVSAAVAGDTITFTNHGPADAYGASVAITLPEGVAVDQITPDSGGSCSTGSGTPVVVTCGFGGIGVGGTSSVILTFEGLPGEHEFGVAASSELVDGIASNNATTGTVTIPVMPDPDPGSGGGTSPPPAPDPSSSPTPPPAPDAGGSTPGDTTPGGTTPGTTTPGTTTTTTTPDTTPGTTIDGGGPPAPGPDGCTLRGTSGADTLYGTPGNDVICGLGGNDTIDGRGGNDILRGGGGNDLISGGPGNDVLLGGSGRDALFGGLGADVLRGGTGSDILTGGLGKDRLYGELGNDMLRSADTARDVVDGGAGTDIARHDTRDRRVRVERSTLIRVFVFELRKLRFVLR